MRRWAFLNTLEEDLAEANSSDTVMRFLDAFRTGVTLQRLCEPVALTALATQGANRMIDGTNDRSPGFATPSTKDLSILMTSRGKR